MDALRQPKQDLSYFESVYANEAKINTDIYLCPLLSRRSHISEHRLFLITFDSISRTKLHNLLQCDILHVWQQDFTTMHHILVYLHLRVEYASQSQ